MDTVMMLAVLAVALAAPPTGAETDLVDLQEDEREFLDSRIGTNVPDVPIHRARSRQSLQLSELASHNGLLVVFSTSPCPGTVRAAEFLSDHDWEWDGTPVIVLHSAWPKRYRRSFAKSLPSDTPLYRIERGAVRGWLEQVHVSPALFLRSQDLTIVDWSSAVPGSAEAQTAVITSRTGSQLMATPNKRMQLSDPP